jgi:hypothetical protein
LGDTPELLAQQMLWEVEVAAALTVNKGLQPAKYKPYLSGLLKVVCELPLHPSQADMEVLQALAGRLSTSITDAALCKDVAAVQQYLQQVAAAAGLQDHAQLEPERVEQLIEHFTTLSVQQRLMPLPLVQHSSSTATAKPLAAARTGRRSSAAGTATTRASTGASQPAAAVTSVRRSTRPSSAAAAAARKTCDVSSDEDSDASRHSGGTESSNDEAYCGIETAEYVKGMQPSVAGKNSAIVSSASSSRLSAGARQPLGQLSSVLNSQL